MNTTPTGSAEVTADAEELLHQAALARPRVWARIFNSSPAYMGGVLIGLLIIFSVLAPAAFLTGNNLRNVALDASVLLVMAVGMTFVMVAGGFDLSIGSVLVFANVMAAKVMGAMGTDGASAVVVGLLVAIVGGTVWGVFNGYCITKLRVPALITTLGTLGAALGAANLLTGGTDVRTVPLSLINFGAALPLGVSWLVWIALLVAVVAGLVLHLTRFGRRTYVIGSNAEAARRAGINVNRHLMALYALSGAAAGLAGILSLAQFGSTTISGHGSDVITVVEGVVLGGTSLFGGIGTVIGTVIGILIPATLNNGFIIKNVQPFWQQVATGLILIAAVYLDQLKRRSRERS